MGASDKSYIILCPDCNKIRKVHYKTVKVLRCRDCYIKSKKGVKPMCVKPKSDKPKKKYDRTKWASYKKQKEEQNQRYIEKEKERNRAHKLEALRIKRSEATLKPDPVAEEAKMEAIKQEWLKTNKVKIIPTSDFSKEYSGLKILMKGY